MTIQAFPGGYWTPGWKALGSNALGVATYVINASGNSVALIFEAPKTGLLRSFEFMVGTLTNAPDSGLRCSFQGVSGGVPDGIVGQSVTTSAGTPSASGWLNPGNFNADRSVVLGEQVAAVIEFSSFVAGDSLAVSSLPFAIAGFAGFPYGVANGTKQTIQMPVIMPRYSDGSFAPLGPGIWGIQQVTSLAINQGSVIDEYGLAFTPAFPQRLGGVQYTAAVAAGADHDIILYDALDSALDTINVLATDCSTTGFAFHTRNFPNAPTLLAGSLYRVVIVPTTANSITVSYSVFNSVALLGTVPGGLTYYATGRGNSGPWTDFNNTTDGIRRVQMSLRADGFDLGTGGSGGGGMHLVGSGGLAG